MACISNFIAHLSTPFDNMAGLWYGKKSSHHYLPLLFSLFRVGVSLSHIHNNITAGNRKRLVTNTPKKNPTIVLHYMHVPWFVIRGQMQTQYVTEIKAVDVGKYLDIVHHLFRDSYQTIQTVVQQYQIHHLLQFHDSKHFLILMLSYLYQHHKISMLVSLN